MNARAVIRRKRDGGELTAAELEGFVRGFLEDAVAPYQMSAFLMAVFLKGMTPAETAALTRVMVESGDVLSYPGIDGPIVDKHSTGGVGDLISLVLAPLAAANGIRVPMISGRGLGHTGGTLDKLESFDGLRTALTEEEFRSLVARVGFAMGGQTESLAPADRRMYALRDVTSTVESIPLIVSSILCKKVAAGLQGLVLDVKCGRGAFMKTEADALALARELTRVGGLMGVRTVAFVTDMDAPLGTAVGNAVEAALAVECLRGGGPADTMELTHTLTAAMIALGGRAGSWSEARERSEKALADGEALRRFRAMVEAQGGDAALVDDPGRMRRAPVQVPVAAPSGGYLADMDPYRLGETVVELGGGRRKAEDSIDLAVGILLEKKAGDAVERGETVAVVLAADRASGEAAAKRLLEQAIVVAEARPEPRPLVRHLVTADGDEPWRGEDTWERGTA